MRPTAAGGWWSDINPAAQHLARELTRLLGSGLGVTLALTLDLNLTLTLTLALTLTLVRLLSENAPGTKAPPAHLRLTHLSSEA